MRTHPTPQDHDTLGEGELDRIKEICADAESSARLNGWETEFIDSIRDRVTEYGARARISAKQWDIIERIEQKLYG